MFDRSMPWRQDLLLSGLRRSLTRTLARWVAWCLAHNGDHGEAGRLFEW